MTTLKNNIIRDIVGWLFNDEDDPISASKYVFKYQFNQNLSVYILFLGIVAFFLLPSDAISNTNIFNISIPEPSHLWYGIENRGLALSYIHLVELFFAFLIVWFFIKKSIVGQIDFKVDSILIVGIAFYALSMFSLIVSYHSTHQYILDRFPLDGLINWGKAFAIYFLLLQILDKQSISQLFKVLIYVSTILAIISIIAFFIFGYFIFQERFIGWRVNVLGMGVNTGGIFLSSIAILSYILSKNCRIYRLYFVIQTLGVLLTGSRAAILALLFSIIIYHILFSGAIRPKYFPRVILFSVVLAMLTILFMFTNIISWLGDVTGFTIFSRLSSFSNITNDQSSLGRLLIWYNYIQIYSESLLFGIGNSDWLIEIISRNYNYPHSVPHSHNFFLQTLIKGGIVATLPILVVFIYNYRNALTSVKNSIHHTASLSIMPLLIFGLMDYGFWNQKIVYLFTILLFCMCYHNKANSIYVFKIPN